MMYEKRNRVACALSDGVSLGLAGYARTCSSSQVSCSICMLGRYQAYLRLLVRSTAGRHNLQTFATSVVAEKKGYSINKIPLTELERSGAKAQLVEILREFDKPATYEELWERAKDHERFKSKRFMKQMMQHLKKIRVAKTLRVDNKHFGYMLTHRAVDGGPVLAAAAAERTVQTQTAS